MKGYQVVGAGIRQWMSERHLTKMEQNLPSGWEVVRKGETAIVREVLEFHWDFENVWPEAPIKYIDFSGCGFEALEGLTLEQARRETKKIAKAQGKGWKETTMPGTAQAYCAEVLEASRA